LDKSCSHYFYHATDGERRENGILDATWPMDYGQARSLISSVKRFDPELMHLTAFSRLDLVDGPVEIHFAATLEFPGSILVELDGVVDHPGNWADPSAIPYIKAHIKRIYGFKEIVDIFFTSLSVNGSIAASNVEDYESEYPLD